MGCQKVGKTCSQRKGGKIWLNYIVINVDDRDQNEV